MKRGWTIAVIIAVVLFAAASGLFIYNYYSSKGEVSLSPAIASCTDTENGMSVFMKGVVTIANGGSVVNYADTCVQCTGTSCLAVQEYSCNPRIGGLVSETYNCNRGCRDGACVADIPFVYGDISQDGIFDARDLNVLTDIILQRIASPASGSVAFRAGDVNGDLKLDSVDRALFADRLVGKISRFPAQPQCLELIRGVNNLGENRLNLVFVGLNQDIKSLINSSIMAVDYYSTGKGIMAIEPFKSNRNKFNFFYVNGTGYVNPSTVSLFRASVEMSIEISRLTSSCGLPNRYSIVFTNLSINSGSNQGDLIKINNFARPETVVHELGHSLAQLQDERNGLMYTGSLGVQSNNCYYPRYLSCTSHQKCTEKGCWDVTNCASTPESIADCEANVDWKDLIGNGCGRDGVIDCPKDFIRLAQERCTYDDEGTYSCTDLTAVLSDPKANVEVSCNLECGLHMNAYKPAFSDIMVSSTSYFSFNPVNERYLCRRIKSLTGSVGGICDKLCLNGCASGKRCIDGACS